MSRSLLALCDSTLRPGTWSRIALALGLCYIPAWLLAGALAAEEGDDKPASVPPELTRITAAPAKTTGLDDHQAAGWHRHDPSNVIRYKDEYLLWATDNPGHNGFTDCRIILLGSPDVLTWKFKQVALEKNPARGWDDAGVLTAFVVPCDGRFYLFYTGVSKAFHDAAKDRRGIGYVVADSPLGPWRRPAHNQVLQPGPPGQWDDLCADDTNIIRRGDKWYLYYKGRKIGRSSAGTHVGLAVSDSLTGPYTKYKHNPLFNGHALTVTKYAEGLIALPGGRNRSLLWSADGIHFTPACALNHRSTGVYNPADFQPGGKPEPIRWFMNVFVPRGKPRQLQRIDLTYPPAKDARARPKSASEAVRAHAGNR
ncbi:MAG: family 43 glycosylhydrolase [Planctomycetes bacterium]|nr:family 43 glycosylhydrolase [Planctomycetota bacterium]